MRLPRRSMRGDVGGDIVARSAMSGAKRDERRGTSAAVEGAVVTTSCVLATPPR